MKVKCLNILMTKLHYSEETALNVYESILNAAATKHIPVLEELKLYVEEHGGV